MFVPSQINYPKEKRKMRLINLTPHEINEVTSGESFPPCDLVARVAVTYTEVDTINGIPLFIKKYGEITGLPRKIPGVKYIVSGIFLEAIKNQGRDDLVAPGELLRDPKGNPIGCMGFTIN